MPYTDQFKRAAELGYILHHLAVAKKHARERGYAELGAEVEAVERTARAERQMILDEIAEGGD